MQDFKQLKVWQRSHQLTLEVYQATQSFPKEEMYGLTSQVRRAAASVPANIAEGCGRETETELARFLDIAGGSANELEYHLLLARDLGYLDRAAHDRLNGIVVETRRMLSSFTARVEAEA